MVDTIEYGVKYKVKPEFVGQCTNYENVEEEAAYVVFNDTLKSIPATSYGIYDKDDNHIGGCTFCLKAEHVELYEEATKPFRVGDRVRLVRPDPQFSSETTRKGMLGTVKVCRPGSYFDIGVRFDDADVNMSIKSDQLELVTGSKATKALKQLPNTVVHCKTKQECIELCKMLEADGWKIPGDSNDWAWENLVKKPTDRCGIGVFDRKDQHHSDIRFFSDEGYDVISLDEFKIRQGLKPRYTTATEAAGNSLTCHDIEDAVKSIEWPTIKVKDWYGVSEMDIARELNDRYDYHRMLMKERLIKPSRMWFSDDEAGKQPSIKSTLDGLRKGIMQALREVPNRLKRALNKGMEAMYQLGWIDGDLDYTEEGTDELLELLHDEYEEKLGALAIKKVAEAKKKAKECKSCE